MEPRILVADDAVFMRQIICEILRKYGFSNLMEVKSGEEAIALYRKEHPDLVLLDIIMPDMSGIEVLKELLKIDSTANVVMCSALGDEKMVLQCILNGAAEYIVKPFSEETLMNAVDGCLQHFLERGE